MSNADEIRWRQRLDNFSHALAQLSAACNQPGYTDLERSGLVQTFEFTFELAWKTLQDLLFYEGYGAKIHGPRSGKALWQTTWTRKIAKPCWMPWTRGTC